MINEIEKIEEHIIKLESRKDKVFNTSREVVRLCGKSIVIMHNRDMNKAKIMLTKLRKLIEELKRIESGFEYNSLQAHQEYTEAVVLYDILTQRKIIDLKDIDETEVAYILGLMDVVGELKREAFEALKNREIENAKEYYKFMLEIYDSTASFRFANSIMPDFRKKQDVARIQIEGTINELLHFENKR